MSDVVLSFRGRQIHMADVLFLRELIAHNSTLSRFRLSLKVCQAWDWVQPNGQPRDMVCRSLMLKLHRAGHIQLPPQRHSPPNNAILHRRLKEAPSCATLPIEGSIGKLRGHSTLRGTCYRAANWTCLGRSLGRGTKSKTKERTTSIKELWVYPLGKDFRQQLLQEP